MGTKTEIEFKNDGYRAILQGDGVRELVSGLAESIAEKANANANGDGYAVNTFMGNYGGGRWCASVKATTPEALKAESENKALSKAVM
ncbi:MAG: hypothetical protein MJZ90_10000 [Bacteroidales bacterium]|nr:hypothetical protein [Bacteroidales bacterium]